MVSTPVTAFYAGVLALIVLVLALRVVQVRRSSDIGLGDGGNELLFRRIRIHGNAIEYLPTAVILMLILELNGASRGLLHMLGIALVFGRLALIQGLTTSAGGSPGRIVGNVLTWGVFVVGAIRAMSFGLGLG